MSKIITAVMLALAIAALANVANGTGTVMPMMKGLKDPTVLADLVDRALQRDATGHSLLDSARCKRDGSCATAHDYFYGIQQEHPSAKMGDIAELPRYLRSLIKQPAPAGEWYMSRLLMKGEKRTYDHMAWHRAFFKGEDVWDDPNTGEHILAGFCENVVGKLKSSVPEKETPIKIRDVSPPITQPKDPKRLAPPRPLVGGCPDIYHLKVYVYPWEAMLLPGVAQTAAKEELEEKFVYGRNDPQHVSRTHYTQLQKALAAGTLHYSSTSHVFRVSLIMTPESRDGPPTITKEEILGEITVKDYFYEIPLLLTQIKEWDAIRLVPVDDGGIASPPRYHKVGFHELRFFFHLPNTKLGEWDSNPDPDCTMGVLFIEKKK